MKLNLTVISVSEDLKTKGRVKVSADSDTSQWSMFSTLNIKAQKGEFEVGDKLEVTVKKAGGAS